MPSDLKVNVPEGENAKEVSRNATVLYEKLKEQSSVFTDAKEKEFYLERAKAYLKDYPLLNSSSDLDNLHLYIVERIFQNRLIANNVATGRPIDQDYNDSVKRALNLMESLAGRRVDRKKLPDKENNLQKEIESLFSMDEKSYKPLDTGFLEEEQKFEKEKKERDTALGVSNE